MLVDSFLLFGPMLVGLISGMVRTKRPIMEGSTVQFYTIVG